MRRHPAACCNTLPTIHRSSRLDTPAYQLCQPRHRGVCSRIAGPQPVVLDFRGVRVDMSPRATPLAAVYFPATQGLLCESVKFQVHYPAGPAVARPLGAGRGGASSSPTAKHSHVYVCMCVCTDPTRTFLPWVSQRTKPAVPSTGWCRCTMRCTPALEPRRATAWTKGAVSQGAMRRRAGAGARGGRCRLGSRAGPRPGETARGQGQGRSHRQLRWQDARDALSGWCRCVMKSTPALHTRRAMAW